MSALRFKMQLNRGRVGVPLHKLAAIVSETQKFLQMLGDDVHLEQEKGKWIGLDFENSSVNFTVEFVGDVEPRQNNEFNAAFYEVSTGKPNGRVRSATRFQFARIADHIDEDEVVGFGLYRAEESSAPQWCDLSKKLAIEILSERQLIVESHGSIQGIIHSLFLGAQPPHFHIRELSTLNLVKCVYSLAIYDEVASVLQKRNAVVHVFGETKTNLAERRIDELHVKKIGLAETISEEDFEKFFGCAPNLTGEESTEQFIKRVRQRA